MTKMEITDDFIAEASEFKVKRKIVKKEKVVVENGGNVKCSKVKKNGECCVYKAKVGGFCGKHTPKSVVSALSDEFVGTSSDETGSVDAGSVKDIDEPVRPECVGCGEHTNLLWTSDSGPQIYGCEPCIEAGAIENIDEEYL